MSYLSRFDQNKGLPCPVDARFGANHRFYPSALHMTVVRIPLPHLISNHISPDYHIPPQAQIVVLSHHTNPISCISQTWPRYIFVQLYHQCRELWLGISNIDYSCPFAESRVSADPYRTAKKRSAMLVYQALHFCISEAEDVAVGSPYSYFTFIFWAAGTRGGTWMVKHDIDAEDFTSTMTMRPLDATILPRPPYW